MSHLFYRNLVMNNAINYILRQTRSFCKSHQVTSLFWLYAVLFVHNFVFELLFLPSGKKTMTFNWNKVINMCFNYVLSQGPLGMHLCVFLEHEIISLKFWIYLMTFVWNTFISPQNASFRQRSIIVFQYIRTGHRWPLPCVLICATSIICIFVVTHQVGQASCILLEPVTTAVIVKLSHNMYLMKNAKIGIFVYLWCVIMCHVPFSLSIRSNHNVIKFMIMLKYLICDLCWLEIEIVRIHTMNSFFFEYVRQLSFPQRLKCLHMAVTEWNVLLSLTYVLVTLGVFWNFLCAFNYNIIKLCFALMFHKHVF